MTTLTLMRFMIAAVAMPMLAAAQVPPVQPVQPPQPAEPVRPLPPMVPSVPWPASPKMLDELDRWSDGPMMLLKEHSMELMALQDELQFGHKALELKHELELDHNFRMQNDQLLAQLDVEGIKLHAEAAKMQAQAFRMDAEPFKNHRKLEFPAIEGISGGIPGGVRGFFGGDKPLNGRPRAAWASEDPADSLYRVAREALNRGEYRRAAQVFNELLKKYPRSQYAVHSQYWEAFARYRAGGTDDLREAIRILDEGRVQLATLRRDESSIDVQALRARIQAALAARGDSKAAEDIKREAPQANGSCDREEVSVRAEALSALGQMDPAAAKPAIRKVLQRRDECTVELRRRALYLLGRQADPDAASVIIEVAKNDPDAGIRNEAMRWLPRVAGDNAVPQLEEMLKTATDEQTQRSIVYALGSIEGDRARRAIRSLIERNDAVERVRYDAIMSLSREKEGRINPEDIAYLRGLYGKLESPQLRQAVLHSVSRAGTSESEQFLLAIARNVNESPSLRAAALQRLGRMTSVGVADIARLYDSADARSLREQILSALSQRKEPEAIDKMMEIARKDTDPQIRRYAISLLSRSNNERAKQFIKEIIEQ
jgi:HEAT repeat protein/TolA-binding protein